jgi:hypothetical protein
LPLVDQYEAGKGYYLHLRARALPGLTVAGSVRDRANLSIEYGDPHPSRIELAIAPWKYEESGTEEVLRLPLRDDPGTHNVEVAGRQGEGMRLRVVGGDPWIRSFVDPTSVRSVDDQEELWVRLSYRSSRAGTGQVFFTDRRRGFREHDSIRLLFEASEGAAESRQVVVPVVGVGEGEKLGDLRLDPPDGADFEIVAVELVLRRREFDDYLVRISSQWRWFSGGVRRLRLTSDAPVLVDSVLLRTGD